MDINKLIKLAKSYDTVGLYHEADKIMIKLAQTNDAVYVAPPTVRRFVDMKNNNLQYTIVYPGRFNFTKDEADKRYERFNFYSTKINEASTGRVLTNILNKINSDESPIGDSIYGRNTLTKFIKAFQKLIPNFDTSNYNLQNDSLLPTAKDSGYQRDQISIMFTKESGDDSVSFAKPSNGSKDTKSEATKTPVPEVTLGDVFKASGSNYAMDPNVSNTVIPNQERYNTILAKIKAATTPEGLNDLNSNLANYGLSITSENGLYAIRTKTPESAASKAQPLDAPKNPVQMSHPMADVNVQQYNLLRQRKQETNQDALRSQWNGYIQSDSFLQELESRLKDIHNQVNPTYKSDVFNNGMIATIESKGSQYKPLIDMYKARKEKTYQNVGDLGPAQMYGTK